MSIEKPEKPWIHPEFKGFSGELKDGRAEGFVYIGRPGSGGGISYKPFPCVFDPRTERLTIPRGIAFGMMLGFADLGDHAGEVPFDRVAFAFSPKTGFLPVRGIVMATISDDMPPGSPIIVGRDVLDLGRFSTSPNGKSWDWSFN